MKFNHLVKHNGVYYPAGTEVPVGEVKPVQNKEVEKPQEKVEEVAVKIETETPKKAFKPRKK